MPLDLSPYAAVLLDLDGTVYHEDHALPGAIELIHKLQAANRPFACLTNSTTSPDRLTARLAGMGAAVGAGQIYTAAAAAADYVRQRFAVAGRRPRVFNLATEGVQEMLDGAVDWVPSADGPCDVVVAGAPANFYATEDRRRTALALLRGGAALVGVCADRVYPSPRGIEFGSGALSHYLGYAADVAPTFCGKPEPVFFHELCRRLNVPPDRCLLVGDNLESDVGGGKRVGMRTILTLSGVATRRDAEKLPPEARPDAVITDLTELL